MLDLHQFLARGDAGRAKLVAAMRGVCANIDPELATVPDDALLEPRLFAWSSRTRTAPVTPGQLLYRGLESGGAQHLQVASDAHGIVFISGVGHLETELPLTTFRLVRRAQGQLSLLCRGTPVAHCLLPARHLPGSRIEWVRHADPLVRAFFADHVPGAGDIDLERSPQRYDELAEAALKAIARAHPALHGRLTASLRSVALFRHARVASFATLGMHGMVFLNVVGGASLAFFIDGLVHQGGHVLFAEATLERQGLFKLDPDTPVAELAGRADARSVYEALQGLYAKYAVLDVLSRIEQEHAVPARDLTEVRARMALMLKRLAADVALVVRLRPHLSELGIGLLEVFAAGHREFYRRHGAALASIHTEGHGDAFDVSVFRRRLYPFSS
jgi:hypothetical protein